MIEKKVFELYRPTRNRIKNLAILDSFQFIWGLGNNLQWDKPLPQDIEMKKEFYYSRGAEERKFNSVFEWELEFLLMDVILHAQYSARGFHSLKKLKYLGKIINEYRNLENEIFKLYPGDEKTKVFQEFNRIAHRQFIWQTPVNTISIYRYFRIYSHSTICSDFTTHFHLTPLKYYLTGILMCSAFMNHFANENKLHLKNLPAISEEMLSAMIELYSTPIEKLKEEINSFRQMNENLFYNFNPLRAKPIIIVDGKYYCPLQTLLFWQITNGVYYRLINVGNFKTHIGKAFEDYVGEILRKINSSEKWQVFGESKYDKPEKYTSDWILEDETGYLFIECKAKRMTLQTKTDLNLTEALEKDLNIMADAIYQTYKTYKDFRDNKYENIANHPAKKGFILIVTFEEWFVAVNPRYMNRIDGKVRKMFLDNGFDIEILNNSPYYIQSISKFEMTGQLIHALGISVYFNWPHNTTISEFIKKFTYKNLIQEDFENELKNKIHNT